MVDTLTLSLECVNTYLIISISDILSIFTVSSFIIIITSSIFFCEGAYDIRFLNDLDEMLLIGSIQNFVDEMLSPYTFFLFTAILFVTKFWFFPAYKSMLLSLYWQSSDFFFNVTLSKYLFSQWNCLPFQLCVVHCCRLRSSISPYNLTYDYWMRKYNTEFLNKEYLLQFSINGSNGYSICH